MQNLSRAVLAALALVSVMFTAEVARAQSSARFDVAISIDANSPGAVIHRNIYGQFSEHLGRGVYEGIWVGEASDIPNTNGYRNDVVKALQALEIPVIRWPGGCFADEYHWEDGIGPRAERPVRLNTSWGMVEDDNSFGTHEFLDFAELIGADAYVAANVGSGTPTEMARWVEYITSDSKSSLAKLRRQNGRDKPWKLPYIGVGNETWGCGGDMRPEYFADLYRRFASFIDAPADNRPEEIASGANVDDYHWTETLMSQAARYMDAFSLHYYTIPGSEWNHKGPATGFGEDQWASTLAHSMRMEELVSRHSAIMDKYDPEKRVGLYVDEWGTWYDPTPGENGAFLYQQNTIRDALAAATTLHIFHRHAERVRMSLIAQTVNVLQAMILTDGPRMLRTPTYHVFRMHIPFQDSTFLPVETRTPDYEHGDWSFPALDVSAARGGDGKIYLSLANRDPDSGADVTIDIDGADAGSVSGEVLTATELDAHNTFDDPDAVVPGPIDVRTRRGNVVLSLPPKSVAVIAIGD